MRTATGGVYPRPNGRYLVRLTIPGKGRRSLGTYATEREANGVLMATLQELNGTVHQPGQKQSFDAYGKAWIERRLVAGIVRASNEQLNWRKYVTGTTLGSMAITSIRRRDVKAWILDLTNKHPVRWHMGKRTEDRTKRLSDETRAGLVRLITQAFNQALDDEIIRANPASGTKARKHGRTVQPWTYLNPSEQTALLQAVPEPDRFMVAFVMGTGIRPSEAVALRLCDLHLDSSPPYVEICFGGKHKPTKSKKPRKMPLFGFALAGITQWLPTLEGKLNAYDLVFPSPIGYYRDRKSPKDWPAWKRDAGLTRRVRWYDLRHTCASSLIAGWWGRRWTMPEVKEMLGHSSVTVTERYAHLAEDALMSAGAEMPLMSLVSTPNGSANGSGAIGEFEIEPNSQSGKPGSNRRHQPWQCSGKSSSDNEITSRDPYVIHLNLSMDEIVAALQAVNESPEEAPAMLEALATKVLTAPLVQLARRVRKGGPRGVAAGIALASKLAAFAQPTKNRKAGGA